MIIVVEYQYLPVNVPPPEELTILENGEMNDEIDGEYAHEEQSEVMQWVVNFTSSSTLVDNPACFYVLSPGVRRHESVLFNTY